ncbi:MAG: pantetheine-phosphate adenylyltransferase [Clostridiales bacterium]|nr:pantetheine-phosphate adenylyltransferase [Clostridiales bacterium]MDY4008758.1 pantetheine-phosphate adenylyltransferase [Candidatus Limiplasma sp.]
MKKGVCVYPGSFDPITNGHLDIIERGAGIFEHVVVAVLHNPAKTGFFSIEQRLGMLRRACAHLPNVSFDCFDGLLMDYMKKQRAAVVLRGLRAITDFENEFQMAQLNRQMAPEVETLFLMTAPEHAYVSSSAVREIGLFGGDITPLVPACIADDVIQALKR